MKTQLKFLITRTIIAAFIFLAASMMTSCSIMQSSLKYADGMQSLAEGDNDAAISHFEEAVRLNPISSLSHNCLAKAYLAKNDIKKAWYHSRQGVVNGFADRESEIRFAQIFNIKLKEHLEKFPEPTDQDIINWFGIPEVILYTSHGQIKIVYANTVALLFEDRKLVSVSWL